MRVTKVLWVRLFLLFIVFLGLYGGTGFVWAEEKPIITEVENNLLPPVLIKGEKAWTLAERMAYYRVPGVSIAVIQDFKIQWSKGYGIKDMTTAAPVTATTLFQAASCSKPLTAMAALKLVRDGKLPLNENINNTLKSWKLPENEFTTAAKVTLKELLSHSAGVTIQGFRGYAPTEKIPTLVEILDGKAPANSSPIRVDMIPGSEFRYSGGGYVLVQQMILDVQPQPFPIFMEDTILKPLGMTRSTFWQPLPADRESQAASGHITTGEQLKGKWHVYPEMAAAGLWTTAEDLARVIVELQLSIKNKSNKILTNEQTAEMLSPFNSNFMALGLMISQRGEDIYFQHGGGNEGFRCFFIGHVNKGYGAVVMTNSDNGDALFNEIIRGIAQIYQWQNYLPPVYEKLPQTAEQLKSFVGKFEVDSDHLLHITEENGELFSQFTTGDKSKLFCIGVNRFVRQDSSALFEFFNNPETGQVSHVEVVRNEGRRGYLKVAEEFMVPMELLLEGKLEEAAVGYRRLRAQNEEDANVDATRLLILTEDLVRRGMIPEGMVLLHLAAEFNPEYIKSMYSTLNTEMQALLNNPSMPEPYREQIKASYNMMLRKLGLKELE